MVIERISFPSGKLLIIKTTVITSILSVTEDITIGDSERVRARKNRHASRITFLSRDFYGHKCPKDISQTLLVILPA
jgi:hypothetical protein